MHSNPEGGYPAAVGAKRGLVELVQVSERWGADLWTWVTQHPHRFLDDALRRSIIRQTFYLLADLHSRGMMHRDLKLANILLCFNGSGYPLVKLCDTGSVRAVPTSPDDACTPFVTSRFYRAPELLLGSSQYGPGVDVWSIATSFVELLFLTHTLTDPLAARALALSRGNGAVDTDPTDPSTQSRKRCVLFAGEASDGHQVAHILNLLGGPTESDIAGLRVPPYSATWLRRKRTWMGTCAALERAGRTDLLAAYVQACAQANAEVGEHVFRTAVEAPGGGGGGADGGPAAAAATTSAAPPTHICKVAVIPSDPLLSAAIEKSVAQPVVPVGPVDLQAFLAARYVPADLADLLARMLRWDPRARMTCAEALFHPALANGKPYVPAGVLTAAMAMGEEEDEDEDEDEDEEEEEEEGEGDSSGGAGPLDTTLHSVGSAEVGEGDSAGSYRVPSLAL
jgi:serine/threonine protein kinase